ncbi:hypothetical protein HKCCSP123_14100 [Rhodobacterales bacterium HKCCSP123]|nr:hypothetical protein [Rhodobacterales bacterium HKCCSP123]
MKTSFEIISTGFARHILGNAMSGDPVRDALRALTMNHETKAGSSTRLKKWAIFRESGSTLASDLVGYPGGDERKASEAFATEIANLKEPVVLVTFTNALIAAETLRATYDPRIVSICAPDGIDTIDTTDPETRHWLTNTMKKMGLTHDA